MFNIKLNFFISPITLFELYSIISRLCSNLVLPKKTIHATVDTIVHFIMEDCNLRLLSKTYLTTFYFRDQKVRIPLEYRMSILLAEKLKLRALDLLHIAYASILEEKKRIFVTGDNEILSKRNIIRKLTGLEIKHPKDLLKTHE